MTINPHMRETSPLRVLAALGTAFAAGLLANPAHAQLTLTAAGVTDGFVLSEFAATNPGHAPFQFGPFGVAVTGSDVLVSDTVSGNMYSFADVDGQTPGSALNTVAGGSTGVTGMASAGGLAYGLDPTTIRFAQYNTNGTVNHDLTGVATGTDLGMAGVPTGASAGDIIATSSLGMIKIDPLANGGLGSIVDAYGIGNGDGVSVSPDGTKFCVEQGAINCYSVATGALLTSTPGFPNPDGTGIITGGAFDGDLIVNNNNGDVDLYDFGTNTITTIATGPTERGDYAMTDPSNGTLLLDESSGVWRLGLTGGCIGAACNPVPEPVSMTLLGSGLAGLAIVRRRRRI